MASTGDDLRDLIASYGRLIDTGGTSSDRCDQLSDLIVGVLNFLGVKARRSRPGVLSAIRTIALPLASASYLVEVAGLRGAGLPGPGRRGTPQRCRPSSAAVGAVVDVRLHRRRAQSGC